jgi:hypothetical protein
VLYQRFLYDVFGNPKYSTSSGHAAPSIPLLNTAVEGAQFIGKMPAMPPAAAAKPAGHGKTNHEDRQKNSKRTGDRGELVVLALEKQRLIQAGKTKLAKQIDHIAQRDDNTGFDILSFDDDGTERPIEVKATTGKNLDRGFYLTHNELEKAGALPNYHLYIVFSAMSKQPRILPLKHPALNGADFMLRPVAFHVTLSTHKTF